MFSNSHRLHSYIGYKSPNEYEQEIVKLEKVTQLEFPKYVDHFTSKNRIVMKKIFTLLLVFFSFYGYADNNKNFIWKDFYYDMPSSEVVKILKGMNPLDRKGNPKQSEIDYDYTTFGFEERYFPVVNILRDVYSGIYCSYEIDEENILSRSQKGVQKTYMFDVFFCFDKKLERKKRKTGMDTDKLKFIYFFDRENFFEEPLKVKYIEVFNSLIHPMVGDSVSDYESLKPLLFSDYEIWEQLIYFNENYRYFHNTQFLYNAIYISDKKDILIFRNVNKKYGNGVIYTIRSEFENLASEFINIKKLKEEEKLKKLGESGDF